MSGVASVDGSPASSRHGSFRRGGSFASNPWDRRMSFHNRDTSDLDTSGGPEDLVPPTRTPWRQVTYSGMAIASFTALLLVVGLGMATVLYAEQRNASGEVELEASLTYFSASMVVNGTSQPTTLDEISCGSGALVRAGASMHFMALLTCLTLVAVHWLDVKPGRLSKRMAHAPIALEACCIVFFIIQNVSLGLVRSKLDGSCRPGLSFTPGLCWLSAHAALILIGFFIFAHLGARYGHAWCYDKETDRVFKRIQSGVYSRSVSYYEGGDGQIVEQVMVRSMSPSGVMLQMSSDRGSPVVVGTPIGNFPDVPVVDEETV